ncbi:PTS system, beta-glucosides-specific IIA component [Schleiferilactobacillus shenzhenensis LY-73]|uniref:PTS system, beta-glucosides-specific IIA component n=1 Tax=Schleiferilactobacillus shenzhenensis LY-73 TaxID=1231336 RepID=U4TNK6_9LACO|nr:PTS system, beta-glucosides-specific IIA component [Schleiferilactobacillus shenzhenensis LY-73]
MLYRFLPFLILQKGDLTMADKKDYSHEAAEIVKNVGGKGNIDSLIHCITRLRFYLKSDPTPEETANIEKLDDVITVRKAQGQYQVVIGPAVTDVYDAVIGQIGEEFADPDATAAAVAETSAAAGAAAANQPQEKRNFLQVIGDGFNALIGVITGSMSPVIGVIAASGIIKGILTMLTIPPMLAWWQSMGVKDVTKNLFYIMVSQAADSAFYFLPILVGYAAARRLGGDVITAATIGGFLTLPTMVTLGTKFTTIFSIGGFNFDLVKYNYSIFPMIVAAWLAKKCEDWLKKVMPNYLHMIFVPLITVLVVGGITVVFTGPIIQGVANGIGAFINWLVGVSGAIGGLIIGGFYQVLVIFGLHWGVVPLITQQLTDPNIMHSPLNAIISSTMVAQGAAVLTVALKTKKAQLKEIGFAATISAFCGVTEPAIYGVNLKYRKVFISGLAGSAVGGLITGLMHGDMYGFTGSLIGFSSFFNPKNAGDLNSFYAFLLSSAAAIIVSMLVTWFWGYKDEDVAGSGMAKPTKPGQAAAAK